MSRGMRGTLMVLSSAVEVNDRAACDHKVVGASRGSNICNHWWTPVVRDAVKLKKESYQALACGTTEATDRYEQAKWCAAMVVAEVKTWAWEEFGEAMENDFQTASKRLRTTIQRLRKGKQCTVNTVYSENGVLLTSTKDVVDRWREILQSVSSIPPVRK